MIADLLQLSLRDPSVYDELSADGLNPRPHWAGLIESLETLGQQELARRWAQAERRIRENGVTYNIYGDPQGAKRPWKLDPVPLLITAEEWRFLEAGIIQRARLLKSLPKILDQNFRGHSANSASAAIHKQLTSKRHKFQRFFDSRSL